jgi:hypothetical protein
MKNLLLSLFGTFLLYVHSFGQSDACTGVPTLTVGATCITTSYSVPGTFSNGGLVTSSCNTSNRDDGWYSFTATSSNTQITATATGQDVTLAIWSACGAGTNLGCGNAAAGGSVSVSLTTVIGVTYYVQLHRTSGNNNDNLSGTICVRDIPPPPANDNCNTATSVPVNSGVACTSSVSGTIANSTVSSQANGCFGTADDDVWYTFVATSTSHYINLNNVAGSTSDLYHSVYSGTCASPGTELICSDPNNSTVTGLTVGNTYRVRVYSWTSTPGQTSTFDICIGTPPPPPANDNCNNAVNVPVNPGIFCTTSVPGTIASATASTQANGCSGTADDDVWYSFVATNTTQYINLNNVSGSTTDLYHNVYAGSCASPGTALICSDPNNSTVTGLTVGNTYYVRVFSWTSTTGQNSTFDVCIATPPPPPANDNCTGATSVPVSTTTCSSVSGTIASATASTQANGCSGTADDDVWYSFVATTPAVQISLTNVTGSTTDLYHSVYSGTCGSIGTALVCSDPNNSTVTGLTVGNTYYVRVYSYTSTAGQTSTFDICIMSAGVCGTPNNQDYCVAPAVLTQGSGTFAANTSGTYTSDIPANLGSIFCGSIENNSWYEFTATATTHVFNFTSVGGTGCNYGIQAQVYNVTEDVNGCCTNFTSVSNCFNPGTTSTGTVTATGLTIGNTYRLMVDGNAGSVCDFTVSNWTATGIIVLGVTYSDLSLTGTSAGNWLKWETSTEVNNDYFIVQRSLDGINFLDIERIEGMGTKYSPTTYSYFDENNSIGLVYYRLKQVDNNGTMNYSDILSLKKLATESVVIYPNPAENELFVNVKHSNPVDVFVYSIDGILLATYTMNNTGSETITISTEALEAGVYFIEFSGKNERFDSKKFIKK